MNALDSLRFFFPELLLLTGAFLAVFLDLWLKNKKWIAGTGLAVLALYILTNSAQARGINLSLFSGCFTIDPLTHFVRILVPCITIITFLLSWNYRAVSKTYEGEYYALFLFLSLALVLMGASTNLLMLYLSVEFVSLTSYLMVGLLKKDVRSKEAAVKYLLFGSVASAFMLYGMSLVYGLSGSLEMRVIQKSIGHPDLLSVSVIALVFFLAGLGFKISMAPFHMWAPDVYEAAPTPVTAFLTVAPKALGFIALIRVLGTVFFPLLAKWQVLLSAMAILTMTIGNLSAIAQTNIKRLIAYSSIAQAGYILMGLTVFNSLGLQSILIYLTVYALTNLGAFAIVILVSNQTDSDEISAYSGLAKTSPLAAASLTLFLVSLAGIPPLAGFIGKLYLFSGVIESHFYVLAVAAALNSAVAAFYYFKIVKTMYLLPAAPDAEPAEELPQTALALALGLTLTGVLLFGMLPHPLIALIQSSVS